MWTSGDCVASACGWKSLRVRAPVSQGSPVHISTSKHPKAYTSALSVMTADVSGSLQNLSASQVLHKLCSAVPSSEDELIRSNSHRCCGINRRSTARHDTAWHSTAQHSTAQHHTAQHGTAQHSTAQHSTAQHSTAQHSTAQHSTAQHSTAQHSAAQHSTARHSIAQHGTADEVLW